MVSASRGRYARFGCGLAMTIPLKLQESQVSTDRIHVSWPVVFTIFDYLNATFQSPGARH
jgi:hypothetical protein